jgi:predicted Zn-dependent protease with MMP-like domain
MSETDERLEEAWRLLEEDGPEEALDAAGDLDEGYVATWVLRATALLDLARLDEAASACEQAEVLGGRKDPGVLWARGEIALARWDVDEADRCYASILDEEREPAALERLALVRDLQERFDEADELLAEAAAVDPELHPLPPRLDDEELDALIEQAAGSLPDELRKHLDEIPIVVEAVPPLELGRAGDPTELPPDILGLFVGASLLERSDEDPVGAVPRIYLFQRNIERACTDRDDVVEQVTITLFHEMGHYLGFDEEGVEGLGLG